MLSLIGIKRASRDRESHLARVLKQQGIAYFVLVLAIQLLTIASAFLPFLLPYQLTLKLEARESHPDWWWVAGRDVL